MDLRCRLDHNERDWLREKAELLERFDVERREWECQLKDMQKKIEEVRFFELMKVFTEKIALKHLAGSGPMGCTFSGKNRRRVEKEINPDKANSVKMRDSFQKRNGLFFFFFFYCLILIHSSLSFQLCCEVRSTRGGAALDSIRQNDNSGHRLSALKEIARVSEELCSYQDEIRKKSGDQRYRTLSHLTSVVRVILSTVLGILTKKNKKEKQTNYGRKMRVQQPMRDQPVASSNLTHSEENSDMETEAPPIPPRTSSWNLSSSNPDTELHIPESPMATMKTCHSPCVLLDRKCNSPSIVRKFEAMLQENEGKVFKDGVITSCSVPSNSNCNTGCCHNRWSCDAGKLTRNKLSTYGTVQKSFSEVNIVTAGKDLCPEKNPDAGKLNMFPVIQEFPVDSDSKEIPATGPSLQGSRRNLMLERKTAEFNRTLFQAEMGRDADCYAGSETRSEVLAISGPLLPPEDATSPSTSSDVFTNVTDSYPKRENPHEAKPQTARTSASPLQQRSGSPFQTDSSRPLARIMNEHPWKPLTLAAYPRPEGSRSNYGAVERILKNYESAALAQQDEMVSKPTELDMLDMAPLPSSPTLRVMQDEEPSVSPPSIHKNFSRPARPANRRLPSRWASRSPTSSSSPPSSPCTTPVIPTSFPLQKHSSTFTYTHGFHIETVII
uniref:MTCL family member 3a n=1 Tax=Cyprinodon variegatus TaxID=28743 RepID=A0A3Q2DF35_CYPVA